MFEKRAGIVAQFALKPSFFPIKLFYSVMTKQAKSRLRERHSVGGMWISTPPHHTTPAINYRGVLPACSSCSRSYECICVWCGVVVTRIQKSWGVVPCLDGENALHRGDGGFWGNDLQTNLYIDGRLFLFYF
jgi:hypothetical protein